MKNSCSILHPSDGKPYTAILRQTAFVLIYAPEESCSWGLKIPLSTWQDQHVQDSLLQVGTSVDLKKCEAKVIVPQQKLTQLMNILEAAGLKVVSQSARDLLDIRIVVYPANARIRIEKESSFSQKVEHSPNPILSPQRKPARVLIVDDSASVRKLLTSVLSTDPDLEVVGSVGNPLEAEAAIIKLKPDVLTLDIHMPGLNGVELLKKLHPKFGIPSVMVTSVSREEGPLVLEALESGAVDYIQKPSLRDLSTVAPILIEKVKMAATISAKRKRVKPPRGLVSRASLEQDTFIAIGSSTGGTEALKDLLTALPEKIPPILIVQHIPAVFSDALARRLNDLCPFQVKEAADGDEITPGMVLIAPGGKQMTVVSAGARGYKVKVSEDGPVNRHQPSVDVLFNSVANIFGKNAVGIILTGMGADGAIGLKNMKDKGARTIAQDEASCVVFGMPKEAIRMGGVDEIVALDAIAPKLIQMLSRINKSAS